MTSSSRLLDRPAPRLLRLVALEEKFTGQMARLQADLSWKMIATVGFFGTVITILNAFIG